MLFPLDRSLGCREAGCGNPVRRATDVIQPYLVTKLHTVRIASVLTANTKLDSAAALFAFFDCNFHELPDATLIDAGKWILGEDFEFNVIRKKTAGIVAAHAKRGLG